MVIPHNTSECDKEQKKSRNTDDLSFRGFKGKLEVWGKTLTLKSLKKKAGFLIQFMEKILVVIFYSCQLYNNVGCIRCGIKMWSKQAA